MKILSSTAFSDQANQETNAQTTVWVVLTESFTSSSFDWYPKECDAKTQFEREKTFVQRFPNMQMHLFPFNVPSSLTPEQITDEIDGFHCEYTLDKRFYTHESVSNFPHSVDEWEAIVAQHLSDMRSMDA